MTSQLETAITPGRANVTARPGVSLTDALLLITCVLWAANYSVVKYGTAVMDPLAYNGTRVLLGAVAFVGLALHRGTWRKIPRRDVLALLALGVLGNCVYQTLFAEGVAHTRAGTAALVLAASPALIAGLGRALGIERVGARGLAGIALSMAGIALVVLSGTAQPGEASTMVGNLVVLAAAVCWSVFTVLLEPYTHRVTLIDLSALTLIGGAIPLILGSLPAMAATSWARVTPLTWGAIAYSGLGSLVLGYLFWYRGVRVLGPTRTAIYSNLQPVIALCIAWLLLGEVPSVWQGAGAGAIIAGVLLTRT